MPSSKPQYHLLPSQQLFLWKIISMNMASISTAFLPSPPLMIPSSRALDLRHPKHTANVIPNHFFPTTSTSVSPLLNSGERSDSIGQTAEESVQQLQMENRILQSRLKLLQAQNDQLLKQQQQLKDHQQLSQPISSIERDRPAVLLEQRLILEDFEGGGRPTFDARGGIVDGWDKEQKRYTEPWDIQHERHGDRSDISFTATNWKDGSSIHNDNDKIIIDDDKLGLSSNVVSFSEYDDSNIYDDDDELGLESLSLPSPYAKVRNPTISALQDVPLTTKENFQDNLCEYDDRTNKWISKVNDNNNNSISIGECPVEPNISFADAMKSRAYWLVGLLTLQSCSGFILSRNELLLQEHPVIVYFLTMLVGAGGNAGNQASVRVIRGLALGTLNAETQSQFLSRELRMACALSSLLSLAGFLRAILFQTPFHETLAITMALSLIVFSSICLGAVLPLLLQRLGVDPAHSSTTIQVVMDILGVVFTIFVSTVVLDSVWGKRLVQTLGGALRI